MCVGNVCVCVQGICVAQGIGGLQGMGVVQGGDGGDDGVDSDVAPRVCGLVDHCTQNMMDDGGSVCSLSGSEDDVWEP